MEYDSYWCFGLWRDEDYEYLKEGSSTIGGDLFASFRNDREKKNIYNEGFVLEGANRWG
jgi:hypothetical protein